MSHDKPLALFSRTAVAALYELAYTPEGVCRPCGGVDAQNHDPQCPLEVLECLQVRAVLDSGNGRWTRERDSLRELAEEIGKHESHDSADIVTVEFYYEPGEHNHPGERELKALIAEARASRVAAETEAFNKAKRAQWEAARAVCRRNYADERALLDKGFADGDLTRQGYDRGVAALDARYADMLTDGQ